MKITDLTDNDVVHCATEEEAKRVLKLAHDAGYEWGDGNSYLEFTLWNIYKSDSCYRVAMGAYGRLEYYSTLNIIPSIKIVSDDTKASTTQIGGNHYKNLAIQPMEYCLKNNLNYVQSNVIKYVTRYKDKNGIEDLKKAKHCIDLLIEYEEGKR